MMELALKESLRALRQDQTHVVLVASRDLVDPLVAELTRELVDTTRVGIASFSVRGEASAADAVLSALGILGADETALRARVELERLAEAGASLTLLIPGALSIDPEVLRDLGELAMQSGNVLRLALIAERDASLSDDPAAQIVAALGTGAAKIDVAPPRCPPEELPSPAALAPPILATPSRRTRSIAVRAERPLWTRRRRRRGVVAGALTAVLALVGIWIAPPEMVPSALDVLPPVSSLGVGSTSVPAPLAAIAMKRHETTTFLDELPVPDTFESAEAWLPGEAVAAIDADARTRQNLPEAQRQARPEREQPGPIHEPQPSAPLAAIPQPPAPLQPPPQAQPQTPARAWPAKAAEPANVTEPKVVAKPTLVAKPTKVRKVASKPAAPASATPRVAVNMNAWPYAEIEIDGMPVGATPIGNLPLSPGWHHVRAVFPDGRVTEERVLVDSLQNHFRIP